MPRCPCMHPAADTSRAPLVHDRAAHVRKDLYSLESTLRDPRSVRVPVWRDLSLVRGAEAALLELRSARELLDVVGELVFLGKLGDAGCFALDVSTVTEPERHA